MYKQIIRVSILLSLAISLINAAPIPQNYKHGWSDGDNDGIPPGFKQILKKLLETMPELKTSDPDFEKDGKHEPYTYGWSDGPNDGIPPGFKQILDKLGKSNPDIAKQLEAAKAAAGS